LGFAAIQDTKRLKKRRPVSSSDGALYLSAGHVCPAPLVAEPIWVALRKWLASRRGPIAMYGVASERFVVLEDSENLLGRWMHPSPAIGPVVDGCCMHAAKAGKLRLRDVKLCQPILQVLMISARLSGNCAVVAFPQNGFANNLPSEPKKATLSRPPLRRFLEPLGRNQCGISAT
jgi:hypothetical protein